MKTIKLTTLLVTAMLFSTILSARANSPMVDVRIMNIESKPLIQIDQSLDTYVSISDTEGITLFSERVDANSSSARVFDFSRIKDGTYFIKVESDLKDVFKTVVVNSSNVEVIADEKEYKPLFIVENGLLKINYFNMDMKDIEYSIENAAAVYYEGKNKANLNFEKQFNISNLSRGKYFAKLEAGNKTYYHHFTVN
jgi:hypothetical protein